MSDGRQPGQGAEPVAQRATAGGRGPRPETPRPTGAGAPAGPGAEPAEAPGATPQAGQAPKRAAGIRMAWFVWVCYIGRICIARHFPIAAGLLMHPSELLLRDGDVSIRPLTPGDAASVYRIRNLPDVARYQGWRPASVAEVVQVAHAQPMRRPGHQTEYCQLAVLLDGVGVVGDLGVGTPDPSRQVELGVVLDPAYQGRGIATRALRLLCRYLFADGFHRVTARVDPRNLASIGLFGRLGFRQEGIARQSYWDAEFGEWTDEVLFAVLASEWEQKSA